MPDITITTVSATLSASSIRLKSSPVVFIGFDSREPECTDVCAHSIKRRTQSEPKIHYLKHRDLRKAGWFRRPWLTRSDDGESIDLTDNKPFSTEFSHTRFLIPALMGYSGWALFCDADMLFLSDISKLWAYTQNNHYAVMCVKHVQNPPQNAQKMDGRMQLPYPRKNWSSFVLYNCGHPANRTLTVDRVNAMTGADLHAFKWLGDHEIGELPRTYNWIAGVSPKLEKAENGKPVPPDVVHYTEGGPWFPGYKQVPLGEIWEREYRHWMDDGALGCDAGIGVRG